VAPGQTVQMQTGSVTQLEVEAAGEKGRKGKKKKQD
jgi:hypothetical protein